MKRIAVVALVITFVTVGAYSRSKPVKAAAKHPEAKQAAVAPVPLSALFPASSTEVLEVRDAKGMVMADAPNHEVVMVRINADGTRSHACVNDEASARAFLAVPKNPAASAKKAE